MDKCWLKGSEGDALHAVLCAAGFNICWVLRALRRQLRSGGLKHIYSALIVVWAARPATAMAAFSGVLRAMLLNRVSRCYAPYDPDLLVGTVASGSCVESDFAGSTEYPAHLDNSLTPFPSGNFLSKAAINIWAARRSFPNARPLPESIATSRTFNGGSGLPSPD